MNYAFRIYRFDPERDAAPHYRTYEVACEKGWTVLDALHHIKWYQDGTLTFRRSCRHEICGSCAGQMNGKNGLFCNTQIEDLGTRTITVEPIRAFPVIKDLVTEMDEFFDRLEAIEPYLQTTRPPTDLEYLQAIENRAYINDGVNCILCGCCTGSCPSFWYNKSYLGPAALLKAFRFAFDSRDDAAAHRLELVDDHNGLWRCHTIFNCNECCPKDLDITGAIQELKKAAFLRRI
jgi:succinate dehydrogenase / fumarate reductase, iron-sulfur subunit